jgi:hypothetical protein
VWKGQMVRVMGVMEIELDAWLVWHSTRATARRYMNDGTHARGHLQEESQDGTSASLTSRCIARRLGVQSFVR